MYGMSIRCLGVLELTPKVTVTQHSLCHTQPVPILVIGTHCVKTVLTLRLGQLL